MNVGAPGPKAGVAVVTVHGTGDTALSQSGEKWFQNGSAFEERLKERLTARGVEAQIVPHLWSGANSAIEREKGARSLAKLVKRLAKTHGGVHLVGHSHGGNVAHDAASLLDWSRKQRRPKLASVTTIGTPFFRTRVTMVERFGAWAFVAMVILSVFLTALFAIQLSMEPQQLTAAEYERGTRVLIESELATIQELPEADRIELRRQIEERVRRDVQLVRASDASHAQVTRWILIVGSASIVVLVPMIPLSFRGIARIRRASRRARTDTSVFSIWHPMDEAISFLSRLESLPVEPFPRWSLARGSRTGGIVWGVRAVIAIPLIGGIILAVISARRDLVNLETEAFNAGVLFVVASIAGAPLIFAVVYSVYRLFVTLVVELLFRNSLNEAVGGALKGIAFGRDGDNRIGDVSPRSHYYATTSRVLDGEVADRMLAASSDSTRRLFEKYRGGLFSVDVEESNAVSELAADALTWDSLIHTTYFDQPEIADWIAEHIVASGECGRFTAGAS